MIDIDCLSLPLLPADLPAKYSFPEPQTGGFDSPFVIALVATPDALLRSSPDSRPLIPPAENPVS